MKIAAVLACFIVLFLARPSSADVAIVNPVLAGQAPGTTLTALSVTGSTFSGQSNANAVNIGPQGLLIASGFGTYPASANIRMTISLTNASFSGTPTITWYAGDASNNIETATTTGCSIIVSNGVLSISSCNVQGSGYGFRGLTLSNMTYNNAAALANGGQSIVMTVSIYDATSQTFLESGSATVVSNSAPAAYTLQTTTAGAGSGTVTPSPSSATYAAGTAVTLTAAPATGSVFAGWSGACSGTALTCQVTMNANTAVTATFNPALRIGAILSSAKAGYLSFFRFYNSGAAAGTVTVNLYDTGSGNLLTQWTTPSIPPGASPQYAITVPEGAANPSFTKPTYYSALLSSGINGSFQYVLWNTANGTLTNLTTCNAGLTDVATRVANVHSSALGATGYPSTIAIYNTGSAAATASLSITSAADGSSVGTYTSAQIPANGEAIVAVSAIESGANVSSRVSSATPHYIIQLTGGFTGYLQDLVSNTQSGDVTDMTPVCTLTAN